MRNVIVIQALFLVCKECLHGQRLQNPSHGQAWEANLAGMKEHIWAGVPEPEYGNIVRGKSVPSGADG